MFELLDFLNSKKLYKEAIDLEKLIKRAYINDAYILIDEKDLPSLNIRLIGKINNKEYVFGSFYVRYIDTNSLATNLKVTGFYQPHRQIEYPYQRLSYGKEMLLALIKYATESNCAVFTAPFNGGGESDNAQAVMEREIRGIKTLDIMISGKDTKTLKIITPGEIYEFKNKFGSEVLSKARYCGVHFDNGMYYSFGKIYLPNGDITPSLPVVFIEFEDIESYNKLKNELNYFYEENRKLSHKKRLILDKYNQTFKTDSELRSIISKEDLQEIMNIDDKMHEIYLKMKKIESEMRDQDLNYYEIEKDERNLRVHKYRNLK